MADEIKIEKRTLLALYTTAGDANKKILEEIYGKEFFQDEDFMKEFIEACKITGDVPTLPFPNPTTDRHHATNAFYMLDILHDIRLKDAVLNWQTNQKKWVGWFNEYKPGSGFRFFGSDNVWSISYANGGARFALPTKEESDEFNTKYLSLINKILKPKNQ